MCVVGPAAAVQPFLEAEVGRVRVHVVARDLGVGLNEKLVERVVQLARDDPALQREEEGLGHLLEDLVREAAHERVAVRRVLVDFGHKRAPVRALRLVDHGVHEAEFQSHVLGP